MYNFSAGEVLIKYYALKFFANGYGFNSCVLQELTHNTDLFIRGVKPSLQKQIIDNFTESDIEEIFNHGLNMKLLRISNKGLLGMFIEHNKTMENELLNYIKSDFVDENNFFNKFKDTYKYYISYIIREVLSASSKKLEKAILDEVKKGNPKILKHVLNNIFLDRDFMIKNKKIFYAILEGDLLENKKLIEQLDPEVRIYFNKLNFKYLDYYYTNFPKLNPKDIDVTELIQPGVFDLLKAYTKTQSFKKLKENIDDYLNVIIDFNKANKKLSENKGGKILSFSLPVYQREYLEDILENKKYFDADVKFNIRSFLSYKIADNEYAYVIEEYLKFLEDKKKYIFEVLNKEKLSSQDKAILDTEGVKDFIEQEKLYKDNYTLLLKHKIFDFVLFEDLVRYSKSTPMSLLYSSLCGQISELEEKALSQFDKFMFQELDKVAKNEKIEMKLNDSLLISVLHASARGCEIPEVIMDQINKTFYKKAYNTKVLINTLLDFNCNIKKPEEDIAKRLLKNKIDSPYFTVYTHLRKDKKTFLKLLNIKFTEPQMDGLGFSIMHKLNLLNDEELYGLLNNTINSKNDYAKKIENLFLRCYQKRKN